MLLGLDVGGTKCACLLGDSEGEIVDRESWPSLAKRGPDAMINDLITQARHLLSTHPQVTHVGVSIGGPLDAARGVILNPPNLPGWDNIPLRDLLNDALDLPVQVHHDAAACALAEAKWGAGRHADTVAYLTCGTGFGLGIVIDGKPYYGTHGQPPELGHLRLTDDGPVGFGVAGSAEGWCAGEGVARIAAWRYPDKWPTGSVKPKDINRFAAEGDPDAINVIQEHGQKTGMACALVTDLFHPQVLTLGSMAQYLGQPWLDSVLTGYQRHVIPASADATTIQPAGLGDRVQDGSALAAAMA